MVDSKACYKFHAIKYYNDIEETGYCIVQNKVIYIQFIVNNNDTTNIYTSDIIKVDTLNGKIELSSGAIKKIVNLDFSKTKILLNVGTDKLPVHIHDVLSSAYFGDPTLVALNGNILFAGSK